MITFKTGNIFEEDIEAIVNTVNCIGIMGRGIALQFKKKYPANFKAYAEAAKHNEIIPGKMFVFENNKNSSPKYIINFPTKRHWRDKSRISDIQSGLHALAKTIQKEKIQSIAIPPLGCGLGGLNWGEVRQLILNTFEKLPDINIIVFEPSEQSASLKLSSSRTA